MSLWADFVGGLCLAKRGNKNAGFRGIMSKLTGPITRKWDSIRNIHLPLLATLFAAGLILVIWGAVYLLILRDMGGSWSDSHWVNISWLAGISGLFLSMWAGPEYFHYLSAHKILKEIFELDVRPEVSKRRFEAEDAAELLGPVAQKKLDDHLVEVGLVKRK